MALPNTSRACARTQMEALVLNCVHTEPQGSGFLDGCQGGGQDVSTSSVFPSGPQGKTRRGRAKGI